MGWKQRKPRKTKEQIEKERLEQYLEDILIDQDMINNPAPESYHYESDSVCQGGYGEPSEDDWTWL